MQRLRRAAMSLLALLTLTSLAMALMSVRSSKAAAEQQQKSTDLTNYIVGELVDRIDTTGNLSLIESVSLKVLEYCRQMRPDTMRAVDLTACSKASRKLGEVRMDQSKFDEAVPLIAYAIDLSKQATTSEPRNTQAVMEAGHAYASMGKVKINLSKYEEAIDAWQTYLAHTETLLEITPENPDFMMDKSYALSNLGRAFRAKGEMDSAIACFEESRRLKKSALAIRPNDDWQFEDIVTESMIAGIDASAGRLRKADTAYGTLIGRLDRLLKNDSGAFDREKELTNLLQHYAMLALELGEIEQAQHRVDQALARLPRLTSNEPGNAIWRAHHANALLIAAEVARHRGNQAEARSKLAEASALLQSDGRENPYSNALKSFVMFKMGILQGDVDGGRAASDALSALKILASDGGYNTIILAADALLLQAAAMAERGDTAAAHAHARDASSLLARLKPGRSDIKVMGLLARVALLGETPPVSSAQAFQRIDKASYRHPDYLEALSLFCRASAGSGREPPSRCRTPESAKVETDPGTGRQ